MSEQNPYEKLGVSENASFEEIQEAKKILIEKYRQDKKATESIEAAYDGIIMERLRMRQEGKIKVPDRIRFAEKSAEKPPNLTPISINKSPAWLQQLIDRPTLSEIVLPSGVFLFLAIISLLLQNSNENLLSLLMALGFGANIYFLNRKEQRFGRAVLITFIALCLGVGLGSLLANLINNGGFLGITIAVGQFASFLTFLLFWIISSFLR